MNGTVGFSGHLSNECTRGRLVTFSLSLSVDSVGGAQCEERGALLPDRHAELTDVRAESGREGGMRDSRLHRRGKIMTSRICRRDSFFMRV